MAEKSEEAASANANANVNKPSTREPRAPKITTLNAIAIAIAAALVIAAFVLVGQVLRIDDEHERAYETYNDCENASTDLMIISDYLTTESRMYVVTGDRTYLDGYLNEFFNDKNREKAVHILNEESPNEQAANKLNHALGESNELATHELYAMRLTAEAFGLTPLPTALANINISDEDSALPYFEKRQLAEEMVLGDDYRVLKASISTDVDECAKELVQELGQHVRDIEIRLGTLTFSIGVITFILLVVVVFTALANYVLVMRPMRTHARDISEGKPLTVMGSREIKDVTSAYNDLFARAQKQREDLKHQAETDPLTGLLNRGSYDELLGKAGNDTALILADVDKFKEVNDTYGHEVGDEILKHVASTIASHFRGTDYVCRIGGDEFAIILTRVTPENKNVVKGKLEAIARDLAITPEGLPEITMSFGLAFSADIAEGDSLYHEADRMLYLSKRQGRDAISVYDGE